jgi:hypothetical protein
LPDVISFDHDLGDFQALHSSGYIEGELPAEEKTGMDCAKWLVDYCINHNLNCPEQLSVGLPTYERAVAFRDEPFSKKRYPYAFVVCTINEA